MKRIWVRLKNGGIVMSEEMEDPQARTAFERILRELELGRDDPDERRFIRVGDTVVVEAGEVATVQIREAFLPR